MFHNFVSQIKLSPTWLLHFQKKICGQAQINEISGSHFFSKGHQTKREGINLLSSFQFKIDIRITHMFPNWSRVYFNVS
jgi:hypothetical protein